MKQYIKYLIGIALIFALILGNTVFAKNVGNGVRLSKCPQKTTSYLNSIVFVGKLNDLGNDKNVKVWFEYGFSSSSLRYKTFAYELKKPGLYCIKVNKLKPCTTYYYRAAAQNLAGTNYGEIKEIKTLCSAKK